MTATETDRSVDLDALDQDQHVRFHGASWADYERLLEIRGARNVPRMTYLQGELELMSPSARHEVVAETIAALLTVWAIERRIPLQRLGATTWKDLRAERGVEADKSYVLGREPKSRPDLAVEVVVTSRGLNELDVHRGLGVPEVWFWQEERIHVHVLRGERYQVSPRSVLLPEIDVDLLARLVARRDQTRAPRLLQRILRRR